MSFKNSRDKAIHPVRCRFYLVRQGDTRKPLLHPDTDNLVIARPTKWGVFLKACACFLFRVCPVQYGFVRLPLPHAEQLFSKEKFGVLHPDKLRINGNIYYIEQWTFLNLCIFCLEGLRYGTFFKAWEWRV